MEKLKQKLSDMFDNQTLSAARNYLRKEKPKQTDTDANITVRKAVLGDNDFNVERDGGPSYLPPKYNSEAANAERDGKRIVPKEITDKVKGFGFTPGTPAFEEAERQFERAGAPVTRQRTPIGSAGSGGSKYAKGGSVSASSRGDGIAQRGKTKGRMC